MRFPGFRKGHCTGENGSNYRENAFSIWKSVLSQGKNAFSFFATIFTIFTSCLGDVFESFAIHAICFSKQNKRQSFFINVITRITLIFLVIRGEITHANLWISISFFEHEPKVALVNHIDHTNKIALRRESVSSVKSCWFIMSPAYHGDLRVFFVNRLYGLYSFLDRWNLWLAGTDVRSVRP